MNTATIISYEPRYQPDFKRLNLEWIERYFTVEKHDLEQLDHPDVHVLPNGGEIFLARLADGPIVGTVAVINNGGGIFELAKMGVSPTAQGQGIGQRLAEAAIDYARRGGGTMIWLETNRRLPTAIALYKRVGFLEVPTIPSPYARADYRMEMALTPAP